jgi:hypothetical protein
VILRDESYGESGGLRPLAELDVASVVEISLFSAAAKVKSPVRLQV